MAAEAAEAMVAAVLEVGGWEAAAAVEGTPVEVAWAREEAAVVAAAAAGKAEEVRMVVQTAVRADVAVLAARAAAQAAVAGTSNMFRSSRALGHKL